MWFRLARFLAIAIAAAGFSTAAVWSFELGWADYWFRKETLAGDGEGSCHYTRPGGLLLPAGHPVFR